jgi:protein-S-isoprenylcysteine O-methyltransferase Ste14
MSAPNGSLTGTLLVIGQFAGIGALTFGGHWNLPLWAWLLFLSGFLVLVAALLSIGLHNITVMPEPVPGNTLSKRGIYRLVRHPMYLSVLLCGMAVTLGAPSMIRWATMGLLLAVLLLKIRHEEGRLTARHPEYPAVMRGVARLLPGLW